jgi:integrase
MPAYRDKRTGRWRYRKWVALPNGTRTRVTGTPATDTKKAAEDAERKHVERVMNPGAVPLRAWPSTTLHTKEVPTLKEYAITFMTHYLPNQKPTERASKEAILKGQLIPYFGHLTLDEIRQEDVDAFTVAQLARGVGPKTVNNRLGVLSTLLGYAIENKVIGGDKLRLHIDDGDGAEIAAVPLADVAKLAAAARSQRYRVAVLLAAEAGLRIGEIRGLQLGDIDYGNAQITIRRAVDTKNNITSPKHGKRRTVPLSSSLAAALADLPRLGLWVVSRLDGGMLGYWAMRDAILEMYERSGVPKPALPWHSLRHTFGTELAGRGVPLPVIKDMMGHASITTTLRYVTVVDDQKRDAIARAFGQQVGNKPKNRPQLVEN